MTREGQSARGREVGREKKTKKKQKEERNRITWKKINKTNKQNNPQNGKRKIDVYSAHQPASSKQ